jgi:hypothetical protein
MTNSAPGPSGVGDGTIPREQDAPRALIALMIVLMFLGVAGMYALVRWSGVAETVLGQPAPLAATGPIFTVDEILEEPVKGNLVGRNVAIRGAPVAEVTGDWVFWIGPDPGRAVAVVLLGEQTARQSERQTALRTGDVVGVFGTIRAVRDVSLLDEPWAMRQDEWERLARAAIYVSALRVDHLGRAE